MANPVRLVLKGAQAVAASVRAMEDPNSVISHKQRVSWIPGQVSPWARAIPYWPLLGRDLIALLPIAMDKQKHDKTQEKRDRRHSGKARSDSLGKVFRVAGLGDEKDRLPDMPNTDENKDKSALGAALVEDEADHEAAGAEGGGQSLEEAELHEDEGIAGEQLVEQGIAEALADVVAEEEGDAGDLAADGHIERGEEGAEDVEDGDKIQQEYAEEEEEEVVGVGEDGVDKEDGN